MLLLHEVFHLFQRLLMSRIVCHKKDKLIVLKFKMQLKPSLNCNGLSLYQNKLILFLLHTKYISRITISVMQNSFFNIPDHTVQSESSSPSPDLSTAYAEHTNSRHNNKKIYEQPHVQLIIRKDISATFDLCTKIISHVH